MSLPADLRVWLIVGADGIADTIRWTENTANEEVAHLMSDEYSHDKAKVLDRRPFRAVMAAPVNLTAWGTIDCRGRVAATSETQEAAIAMTRSHNENGDESGKPFSTEPLFTIDGGCSNR